MLSGRRFKIGIIVILLFVFPLAISACANNRSLSENNGNEKSQKTLESNVGKQGVLQNTTESGPVTYVPWEDSEEFQIRQAENSTPIMMAAYRTVLHDPLPGEEENVHLAARILSGTIVKPGQTFSQNKTIGPYVQSKGFKEGPTYLGTRVTTTVGGGVCKIASTLYNVAILSNLPVVERYAHNMPVPYVPYGQDATVSYGNKDVKFINNTSAPILIWAQGVGNTLYIAFYGTATPPQVEWHHETLKVYKAQKIYKLTSTLPKGEEKLLMEGMDGGIVKSWITIKNPDGTITTKQLGNSYYNPMAYVYEKGK